MKKGRFTRPLRLSRNYSFADKQERTVGRSKVVRKYKNGDTCSPFLWIAMQSY